MPIVRTRIDKKSRIIVRASYNQKIDSKPQGFWYSVNGDWERWCRSEQPDWLKGMARHNVRLGNEVMLCIRSLDQFDRFHEKYAGALLGVSHFEYINWRLVAEKYDGVEIAPYLWSRRHDHKRPWYYGWDCASGCIWMPCGVQVISTED